MSSIDLDCWVIVACYGSGELKTCLEDKGVHHIRGAHYHPMPQDKIERWHRTMKNMIKLDNYYFPSHLEKAISDFVNYYNIHCDLSPGWTGPSPGGSHCSF